MRSRSSDRCLCGLNVGKKQIPFLSKLISLFLLFRSRISEKEQSRRIANQLEHLQLYFEDILNDHLIFSWWWVIIRFIPLVIIVTTVN
jgi:hypothetical protein